MFFIHSVLALFLAFGQQAVSSATVSGVVQGGTGALIPSIAVTILNVDRNQTVVAQTDDRGRFRFPYLPVGAYKLDIQKAGFADFSANLTLTVGQVLDIPVVM